MAETLGALCDKLTIVKLKQWHSEDPVRLSSLNQQENQLIQEIDEYVERGISGQIPPDKLVFAANKVFKAEGNQVSEITGNLGAVFAELAHTNCALWHEQEKVYDFESVPAKEKDKVVKELAILNLKRNKCIDRIDTEFKSTIDKLRSVNPAK